MAKKQVTIPIFLPNLGCPNRCIFCNQGKSSGAAESDTIRDAEEKINTYLAGLYGRVENVEVAFFGGNFTGLPPLVQEGYLQLALHFKNKGSIRRIRLSTRPDFINPEKMDLLVRYQVDTIEMGVQSFSDEILAASSRGHTSKDVYRAVELCRGFGVKFVLQLMAGLPGDTREGAIGSAKKAASLGPEAVRIFPAVVLKDTALARLYEQGLYRPLDLEEAIEICKEMLLIFQACNIPVIRIGLHPFENDGVVAGPYHPSFGFFVKSRAKRDELESEIGKINIAGRHKNIFQILLPWSGKEEYIGPQRKNILYIENKFPKIDFRISVQRKESRAQLLITPEE